jgi:hypothetical protein
MQSPVSTYPWLRSASGFFIGTSDSLLPFLVVQTAAMDRRRRYNPTCRVAQWGWFVRH